MPPSSPEAAATNGMTRREELLAVATKLFAARGYHGTRMDDVADAVGLNKATVYHYYASKSLILYDIYKGAADFTVDALHDDPTASARETIYHFTRRLLVGIAGNIERAAVYFQEGPYISEWFTEDQVAYIREKETQVYEHVRDVIDRGIASGEFYDCDSHVLALGYIGMTLGSYRWLRPHGRRTAQEIAEEFSTALLRGLIRDEVVRVESPLGIDVARRPSDLPPARRRWRCEVHPALAARSRLSALRMAADRRADETGAVRRTLPRNLRRRPRSVRAAGHPILRAAQQEERRERTELRRRNRHRHPRGQAGAGRVRRRPT